MTLQDWVEESRERYENLPVTTATRRSLHAFQRGAVRRTLDRWIGKSVWDRGDWDVLVILDACRVDQMREIRREYAELPNAVDSVWSNASSSIDWINRTFNVRSDAERAGYVTANPFARHSDPETQSADLSDDDVAHLDLLYKTHWQDIGNGIETVPPKPVTDHAIDAWRRRDELEMDRLIIHYMQPHEPFRSRPEWGNGDHKLLKNLVSEGAEAGSSVYPLVQSGEISLDEFWEVYQDNLRWVLDDVCGRLLTNMDAKVAISADHGNGLGEWGCWHHPPGTVMPGARRVPWVTVDAVDNQSVSPQLNRETSSVRNDVDEQLRALGYQ